jgi:hypothetical protein
MFPGAEKPARYYPTIACQFKRTLLFLVLVAGSVLPNAFLFAERSNVPRYSESVILILLIQGATYR